MLLRMGGLGELVALRSGLYGSGSPSVVVVGAQSFVNGPTLVPWLMDERARVHFHG
jgi:hypothetical protein